jgi:hypothetical protein
MRLPAKVWQPYGAKSEVPGFIGKNETESVASQNKHLFRAADCIYPVSFGNRVFKKSNKSNKSG